MRKKKIVMGVFFCILAGALGFVCARMGKNRSGIEKDKGKVVENAEQENVTRQKEGKEKPEAGSSLQAIILPEGNTLKSRIAVPEGYTRTKSGSNSLGSFLRSYPLKKHGSPVLLYNGSKKRNQNAHAAVFKLPLEAEDLQQCADSVMRVYAEYFWRTGQKERIAFHFVDGFLANYTAWRDGGRIQVGDSRSTWVQQASYDASYENFQKYLRMVFAYAGTLSMEAESKKTTLEKLRIGDVFIKGASPGHVVMVVDVCENEEGKKAFLLGQGYMPAQEFHLLKNPAHEENPWYYEEEVVYPFQTPEYTFEEGSLRRLTYY